MESFYILLPLVEYNNLLIISDRRFRVINLQWGFWTGQLLAELLWIRYEVGLPIGSWTSFSTIYGLHQITRLIRSKTQICRLMWSKTQICGSNHFFKSGESGSSTCRVGCKGLIESSHFWVNNFFQVKRICSDAGRASPNSKSEKMLTPLNILAPYGRDL